MHILRSAVVIFVILYLTTPQLIINMYHIELKPESYKFTIKWFWGQEGSSFGIQFTSYLKHPGVYLRFYIHNCSQSIVWLMWTANGCQALRTVYIIVIVFIIYSYR